METYCEVFERKEVKYRLDARQHAALLRVLDGRMELDAFGRTTVASTYLDTPERLLIERSLDKPLYKEKLRIRSYRAASGSSPLVIPPDACNDSPLAIPGIRSSPPLAIPPGACNDSPLVIPSGARSAESRDPARRQPETSPAESPAAPVFIELKKKYQGIVYKRRVRLSRAAARAYLGGMPYGEACACHPLADPIMAAESLAPRSIQISREIDAFIVRYRPLVPSMAIACEREAYAPVASATEATAGAAPCSDVGAPSALRITFDTALSYRDLFAAHAAPMPLIGSGECIMEIKNAGPFPLWLVHALSACEACPSSFSKYGAAYRQCARPRTSASRTAPVLAPHTRTALQERIPCCA